MKQRENRPFRFSVSVWLATFITTPIVWFVLKHLAGFWDPSLQSEPWHSELSTLPLVYLLSFAGCFLLLGVFYFVARLVAATKMPGLLAKAVLSVCMFGLIWLAFSIMDADLGMWTLLLGFRCYYILAILFIWIFPLRNKKPAIVSAGSKS